MLNEEIRIGLTFDNVLLVPAKSEQISEQIRDPSHIITMKCNDQRKSLLQIDLSPKKWTHD